MHHNEKRLQYIASKIDCAISGLKSDHRIMTITGIMIVTTIVAWTIHIFTV